MYGYVYCITCLKNGRQYVGQKKANKFAQHYWGSSFNDDYWNDLKTYGQENFKREILEWCETMEQLGKQETYWIREKKSMTDFGGYNLCEGNIVKAGWHLSQKAKQKISQLHKEGHYKMTDEIKKKISEAHLGFINSKEHNQHISEKVKEIWQNEEHVAFRKKRISESMIGIHWWTDGITNKQAKECPGDGWHIGRSNVPKHKEEWKKAASEQKKQYVLDHPEFKEKISKALTGKKHSEEFKQKQRDSKLGRKWWTNGVDNKFTYECPEGYWHGATQKR
jgi:group I intron endonuclease